MWMQMVMCSKTRSCGPWQWRALMVLKNPMNGPMTDKAPQPACSTRRDMDGIAVLFLNLCR